MPMPNSAVMIGRPIASTEPNATSRMKTAASIPIASVAAARRSEKMSPPSSTVSPGTFTSALTALTPSDTGPHSLKSRSTVFTSRVGDRAVFRDLVLALAGVRAHDAGHARHLRDLGEHRLHRGLHLRVGHPLLGLEHDRAAVTRRAGSATRAGRTRCRLSVLGSLPPVREVAGEHATDADRKDKGDDPHDQDDPTVAIRRASDPLQHLADAIPGTPKTDPRGLRPWSLERSGGGADGGEAAEGGAAARLAHDVLVEAVRAVAEGEPGLGIAPRELAARRRCGRTCRARRCGPCRGCGSGRRRRRGSGRGCGSRAMSGQRIGQRVAHVGRSRRRARRASTCRRGCAAGPGRRARGRRRA